MLLHDFLLHAERTSAHRTAIIDGDLNRTYRETVERIRRAASGLIGRGLQPAQRVAVLSPNNSHFYEAFFALSLAGLVAVPVNVRLSASEVAFILEDSDSSTVLCDHKLTHLVPTASGIETITLSPDGDSNWDELIQSSERLTQAAGGQTEDDVAHIFYTGGTTGRSKGVMLSHRNVATSAINKVVLGSFTRDDVWLHAAPMFHQADAWAVFSFTGLGAKHVFMPSFEPGKALGLIDTHGVTGVQLVPTMIFMMLDQSDANSFKLASVRRILYGSAPMPTEMLRRAKHAFGDVFQHIYGLTEAAGTVAATPWPPQPAEILGERMSSCGQAITGVELRIANSSGMVKPTGEIGHIQARGANIMTGYWNREADTAAAFVDGWLDTGDMGRIDSDGFVYIVDRSKDMIISGGENIYSTEVEDVIYSHPAIAEAAIIGIADERWGEAAIAVVVLCTGSTVTSQELSDHCRKTLAAYKCPKSIHFVQQLPKSATGKILKHELRRELAGTVI